MLEDDFEYVLGHRILYNTLIPGQLILESDVCVLD